MSSEASTGVSVIIPVFNGSSYIEETISSLLAQTFLDFEIICINDSSTDNSLNILEDLAGRDSRIKVFTKPNGGTVAKAIIYGLNFANGRYFMYSSQDDLFSNDLLEKNFNKAQEYNADAVVPDMVFYTGAKDNDTGIIGVKGDRNSILTGREAFILSLDWIIHGFVLWKMDLVRKVGFFDFGINGDEYTTRMLYFNSSKVVFTDGIFYYRQNNPNAITKKWNRNLLESFDTCSRLESFLIANHFNNNEIAGLYVTIMAELIRIQGIYYSNRKIISKNESALIIREIRTFYHKYWRQIKLIQSKTVFHKIKLGVLTANFNSFQLYCRMSLFYNNLKMKLK